MRREIQRSPRPLAGFQSADGASNTMLRTPRPLRLTGSDAWFHLLSFNSTNPNPNPNPNGLFGIAALMLDYNDSSTVDFTAESH